MLSEKYKHRISSIDKYWSFISFFLCVVYVCVCQEIRRVKWMKGGVNKHIEIQKQQEQQHSINRQAKYSSWIIRVHTELQKTPYLPINRSKKISKHWIEMGGNPNWCSYSEMVENENGEKRTYTAHTLWQFHWSIVFFSPHRNRNTFCIAFRRGWGK